MHLANGVDVISELMTVAVLQVQCKRSSGVSNIIIGVVKIPGNVRRARC